MTPATLSHILSTGRVSITYPCPACEGSGVVAREGYCAFCRVTVPDTWLSTYEDKLPCGHRAKDYRPNDTCAECLGTGTIITDIPLAELLRALKAEVAA